MRNTSTMSRKRQMTSKAGNIANVKFTQLKLSVSLNKSMSPEKLYKNMTSKQIQLPCFHYSFFIALLVFNL